MPMAAFYRFVALAVACFEVVVGQVGFERDVSWHATVLQHSVTTSYNSVAATKGRNQSAVSACTAANESI